MAAHLILLLDAPWMAWGGEVIDAYGVVRPFPGRSTIAGLLANALGYDRAEGARLDRLQARLVMGSARLAEGHRVRDYQTVRLFADDAGWTTRGRIEERNKTSSSFQPDHELHRRTGEMRKSQTHERFRDADADALLLVALRLDPADEAPMLDELARALDFPERPLFLGRKPCLPSRPLLAGRRDAPTVRDALAAALPALLVEHDAHLATKPNLFRLHRSRRPRGEGAPRHRLDPKAPIRAQWPEGEGDAPDTRALDLCDERDWVTGVHGGQRRVVEGSLPAPSAKGEPRPDAPPGAAA